MKVGPRMVGLVAALLAIIGLSVGLYEWRNASAGGVILAAGDVADCRNTPVGKLPLGSRQTARLLERQPGIILGLGDLAYPKGELKDYRRCFNKVWGSLKHRIYPIPGNHEYKSDAVGYKAFWKDKAGDKQGLFYSFDYAGWHLVALNSEIETEADSVQAKWLEDDLNRSTARCILAFFHRPAFSADERPHSERAKNLFDILYRHGATLALSGHNHFYERTAPLNGAGEFDQERGLRQFVVGTGGKGFDHADAPASFTEALIMNKWGVLRIDLKADRYKWRFLSADGLVEDRGKAKCVKPVRSQPASEWQTFLQWIARNTGGA